MRGGEISFHFNDQRLWFNYCTKLASPEVKVENHQLSAFKIKLSTFKLVYQPSKIYSDEIF